MNARIETRIIKTSKMVMNEEGEYEREEGEWEKETIAYDGIGHGVAAVQGVKGWGKVYSYGGKLTENIVQAIARDILLYGMMLAAKFMDIVLHCHDEIMAEVKKEKAKEMLKKLIECMSTVPEWAVGLTLGAEGYVSSYYKKG
jgi:DNA polymerase